MKRENFQDRMKKEEERLKKKETTIKMVKRMYARFGNKVLTYMINYATTENGMIKLFKTLGVSMTESYKPEDQHMAVVEWLNKNGERSFLQIHRVNPLDSDLDLDTQPGESEIDFDTHPGESEIDFDIVPIITKEAKKPLYVPAAFTEKVCKAPEAAPEKPAVQQKAVSQPPVSPPAPPKTPAAPVPQAPAKGKTWPEVDRRSGKERRQKPDRRTDVDLIFKNKRFGGERRKGKDRRKNWKPTA